jgi:DNA-binding NarL/FixJ family response regulator
MAPERQRTLESAIDWSYRLLSEPERTLWQRLSVFAGGFELDAARRVCADGQVPADTIPGLLSALVDRSLVARETRGGRARFRILDVLRTVARDRLQASGTADEVGRRHATWVSALAADVGTNDARQVELFARARAERANIWAALRFCAASADDAPLGVFICRDLWAFWHCARPVSEIVRLLETLIAVVPEGTRARATALWVAGALHAVQRDLEPASRMAAEALELGRRLGDAEVVEWSLLARCHRLWYEGRWAESDAVAAEAYGLAAAMEMPFATMVALYSLASAKLLGGDADNALDAADRAVALSERLGETWLRAYVLNLIGHIRLGLGDPSEAERLARVCLALRRDLGDGVGVRHSFELLVLVSAAGAQWDRAATFLGAADTVWRAIAGRAVRLTTPDDDGAAQKVRDALGGAAFDVAYARGLRLTPDEAIEFALASPGRLEPRPSRRAPGVLSPRELEVARLVADGASNGETAARLFISERTVETHVASIFNKLGLESRVQVARWFATQESAEA